jgi:hypothetical protein
MLETEVKLFLHAGTWTAFIMPGPMTLIMLQVRSQSMERASSRYAYDNGAGILF